MAFQQRQINTTFRVYVALGVVAAVFFILFIRLWYLQIVQGAYFRVRSENNLYRSVFVPPPRGFIFDRAGRLLVRNRPSFNVELITADSPDPIGTVRTLAEILGLQPSVLIDRLKEERTRPRFEPRLILKDVSRDVVSRTLANQFRLPGINVQVVPARDYIYGNLGAHVLGYLRQVTKTQLENPQFVGYKLGDIVGQYGIEYRWESYLQGVRGERIVTVNANGIRVGEQKTQYEQQGHNLTLTLNLAVQQAAEEAMKDVNGGIVALDPRNGEVLAMVSTPSFDPNSFAGGFTPEQWRQLTTGPEKRLNNRVIQGEYHPGSTFKILMAIAALSERTVGPMEHVFCGGGLQYGGHFFHCHKKGGHGSVALREAIQKSCNVYFYTMGQRLTIDRISEWSAKFGLGERTGINLFHESPAVLPSNEWKRKRFKEKWYPGETLSVAIGQGALTVTPLQMAVAYAAVANGGTVYKPYLVKQIESTDGAFLDREFHPDIKRKIAIRPEVLEKVRDAMRSVVEEQGGTGSKSRLDLPEKIDVAGKTGTAQVASLQKAIEDHAWFVAYAPFEAPEIVVAALVEHGGHGGTSSAPRVRQVMEAYFRDTRNYPPPTPMPSPSPTPEAKKKRA